MFILCFSLLEEVLSERGNKPNSVGIFLLSENVRGQFEHVTGLIRSNTEFGSEDGPSFDQV